MKDRFNYEWIIVIMHVACVILLLLCFWRNRELFQEPIQVVGGVVEPSATPSIAPAEPSVAPSIAPTEPSAAPSIAPTEPSPTPVDPSITPEEERSEPIQDEIISPEPPEAEISPTEAPVRTEQEIVLDKYETLRETITAKIEAGDYQVLDNEQHDWWFVRKKNHVPSGSGAEVPMNQYLAFFRNEDVTEEDKVIYLTFDCGYEIGCTPTILDTLAEHNAKALFFVTKAFIQKNPELVKRMKEEGHLVGNHTLNHPVMPTKDEATLLNEIVGCAELFYNTTGYELDPFFRPPTGAYSERTLQLTEDIGYATIFWSIAYKDYDTANQPGKDYVVDHFTTYFHNGAIPLIHNTSTSNTEALGDVLTLLENEGFRFGSLYELISTQEEEENR